MIQHTALLSLCQGNLFKLIPELLIYLAELLKILSIMLVIFLAQHLNDKYEQWDAE